MGISCARAGVLLEKAFDELSDGGIEADTDLALDFLFMARLYIDELHDAQVLINAMRGRA